MSESDSLSRMTIPEHLMLSRLAQSEQMREFFIQMWIQNPALARQGGIKVQNLLSPLVTTNAVISPNAQPVLPRISKKMENERYFGLRETWSD